MMTFATRTPLGTLEVGLRNLKTSQLMGDADFQDMYGAIERHHRELKLAHLTGMAKDMMKQIERDTKFFHILVKMLCEVSERPSTSRQANLAMVYSWYQSNKNVLAEGPKFGQAKSRGSKGKSKKAAEALDTTMAMKRQRDMLSPHAQQTVASALVPPPSPHLTSTPRDKCMLVKMENGTHARWEYSRSPSPDWEHTSSSGNGEDDLEKFEVDHNIVDQYEANSTQQRLSSAKRPLSTVRPPQERISSAGRPHSYKAEREESCASALPSNVKHPITSLVNPHTTMYDSTEDRDLPSFRMQSTTHEHPPKKVSFRPVTAPALSSARMKTWREFYQDNNYGQEILSKVKFENKSETSHEVRCEAHGRVEMPEWYTKQVIASYNGAQREKKKRPRSGKANSKHDESDFISSQTLEEFYQTTDRLYPHQPMKPTRRGTCKSAPPQGRTIKKTEPLGKPLQDLDKAEKRNSKTEGEDSVVPNLKMNTMMAMLDSVTSNMAHHKDKQACYAQSGICQPVTLTPPSSMAASSRNRPKSSPARWVSAGSRPSPARPHRPHTAGGVPQVDCQSVRVQDIHMPTPDIPASRPKSALTTSTTVGKMSQAVDWRGKVSPDARRHKWGKSGLTGHTYVQTLKKRRQTADVNKRPQTAPATRFQECEERTKAGKHRASSRASSHGGQHVQQREVDEMMIIQPLGGTSEDPRDWFHIDADVLARLGRYTQSAMSCDSMPTMQFLSFVTPKGSLPESGAHGHLTRHSEKDQQGVSYDQDLSQKGQPRDHQGDSGSSSAGYDHPDIADLEDELHDLGEDNSHWEGHHYDKDELKLKLEEDDDACDIAYTDFAQDIGGDKIRDVKTPGLGSRLYDDHENPEKLKECEKENISAELETAQADRAEQVVSIDDLNERTSNNDRSTLPKHLQKLSITNPWKFVGRGESLKTDVGRVSPKRPMSGRAPLTVVKPENQTSRPGSGIADKMSSKDSKSRRSAGGIHVTRSRSAGCPSLRLVNKTQDPKRTAPSIPSSHHKYGGRSPRASQAFMSELEHYARKAQSPRHYVQRVGQLRILVDDSPRIKDTEEGVELSLGSLTVCKLPVPDRPTRTLSAPTKEPISREPTFAEGASGRLIYIADHDAEYEESIKDGQLVVCGNVLRSSMVQCQHTDAGHPEHLVPKKQKSARNRVSLLKVGRPIPTELEVTDPDDLLAQVEKQREAKAAVDIQRIFRGYVARNYYNKLLKEEREHLEDQRMAAIAIQRSYREHMTRTEAIYNRPAPDPALQTWAKEYEDTRKTQEVHRRLKRDTVTRENAVKHHETSTRLSVIGPHVNIYQIYHPKKSGISMKELHKAATVIQKHVRGMLVRNKLIGLQRKCVYHGSNWNKSVREYRDLLRTVQERHGVLRPKLTFTVEQMSEYIDLRRRYESVFEKKAYGGELELEDLPEFFKECDLHPSQAELEEAVDMVFRGTAGRKKGRGVYKNEAMEILFHIYAPPATGLEHQRKSTWMNPIIDGEEGNKLIGSEFVENAPLDVCVRLVINSRRERKERGAAERKRLLAEREMERPSEAMNEQVQEGGSSLHETEEREDNCGEQCETEVTSNKAGDDKTMKHVKWSI